MNFIKKFLLEEKPKEYTANQLAYFIIMSIGISIGIMDIMNYIKYVYLKGVPGFEMFLTGGLFMIMCYIGFKKGYKWIHT